MRRKHVTAVLVGRLSLISFQMAVIRSFHFSRNIIDHACMLFVNISIRSQDDQFAAKP
jgi:hypothetical protein